MKPKKLSYYKDLVLVLLSKEFKVRYKSTLLGYAWSLLHPLLFAAVFFLIFKLLMRVKTDVPYTLFLITALFPWQWFVNSVNAANFFFLGNSTLIKKVRFPRDFLVLAGVLSHLLHFVISIPVIVLFMLYYHYYPPAGYDPSGLPSVHWLWQIPLLVGVQFLITQGLALIVATLNLFFRDLERLTGILTLLWFYLTPVIYPRTLLVEAGHEWALFANPMASLIACWRDVLLHGTIRADMVAAAAGFALVSFVAGYALYRAKEWRFAEIV